MQSLIQEIRLALEAVVTPEARLVVSAVLLAGGAVFALLAAPWVVKQVSRLVDRGVYQRETVPLTAEDVRWLPAAEAAVRGIQVVSGLTLLFALLVVWGYVGLAVTVANAVMSVVPLLGQILITIVLVAGAVLGTDLLESWLESYAEESAHLNEHQEGIVFRVLQLVLLIAAGLAALTVWNYNLDGLLVGAGFLGIVVGMAARQTLGSLIAGFVLMFSRPFEIGDWVQIEEYEGMVTDITIVNTRLRNFDGETVVIPNDRASNSTIVNRTDRDRLRLRLEVGIDYQSDLEHAEDVAEKTLKGLEEARRVPSPQVIPKSFGDSGVGLELRFWIDNPSARRRWRAHAEAVREIKAAFDAEGIKIPYPQRELSGREETGGFRIARDRVEDTESATPPESPSAGTDGGEGEGN